MTLDELFNNAKCNTQDAGYEEGHVSHRKNGDFMKQGGSWVPVKGQKQEADKKEAGADEQTMRQSLINFMTKGLPHVPEADAKKAIEGLPADTLNEMFNNLKEQHGDKYLAKQEAEGTKVQLGERAKRYIIPSDMSDEDKVFKALNIELDESFGDKSGNPDEVETYAEYWLEHAKAEGGIGIKPSHRQEATPLSSETIQKVIEANPDRWNRIIKNAKKFYSGNGHSANFESDEFYPEEKKSKAAAGSTEAAITPELREKAKAEKQEAARKESVIREWLDETGLQKKAGAGIPEADEKTFVGKTYKDFAESARASGYSPKTEKENPDGSSSTTFKNKEGKSIRVDFDKKGKIQKVEAATGSTGSVTPTPKEQDWTKSMLGTLSNQNIEDYIKTLRTPNSAEGMKYEDPARRADILEQAYKQKKEKNAGWMNKITTEYKDLIAKNPKLKQYLDMGRTSQLEVKGEGTYLGEEALGRFKELSRENRENERNGKTTKQFKMGTVELDEPTARDLIGNYLNDAAPKLTGDCKVRLSKIKK